MNNIIEIFSQNLATNGFTGWLFVLSFLGGVISSLSPCTLGILPIIVGYVAGYSNKNSVKTFIQMLCFILGMAIVLTTLGLICAMGGKILINRYAEVFSLIISSIILIMGLNLIGILDIQMPVIIKQMPQSNGHNLVLYPLLIGATFALASTPCSTPILAGIMAFASLSADFAKAGLMLFLFAIGQGIVFVLAGVFTSLLKGFRTIGHVSELLLKFSGFLLIFASCFMYWKIFSELI